MTHYNLFPKLKRGMVLHIQNAATSEDPLDACLQRAGWNLNRVGQLRENIFDKQQLDIFGKPASPLNNSECELLQAIQVCKLNDRCIQ